MKINKKKPEKYTKNMYKNCNFNKNNNNKGKWRKRKKNIECLHYRLIQFFLKINLQHIKDKEYFFSRIFSSKFIKQKNNDKEKKIKKKNIVCRLRSIKWENIHKQTKIPLIYTNAIFFWKA